MERVSVAFKASKYVSIVEIFILNHRVRFLNHRVSLSQFHEREKKHKSAQNWPQIIPKSAPNHTKICPKSSQNLHQVIPKLALQGTLWPP
jgi:hypothetical protein